MADAEQLAVLDEGAAAWNAWRESRPDVRPDLSAASLRGRELAGVDLTSACLIGADFTGSNLAGADLSAAEVRDASFRGANLANADLSSARGLLSRQLAAAKLENASLPEALSGIEGLADASAMSRAARGTFFVLLGACAYSLLAIAQATDAVLLSDSLTTTLPIIGTRIRITRFMMVTPVVLLCFFLYVNVQLQRMWTGLSELPAIFPGGGRLDSKCEPWLLTRILSRHVGFLGHDRPVYALLEARIATFLAWWFIPLTLFFFWFRSLSEHDWRIATYHAVATSLAGALGVRSAAIAVATIRGQKVPRFSWIALLLPVRDARGSWAFAAMLVILLSGTAWAIGRFPGIDPRALYDDHHAALRAQDGAGEHRRSQRHLWEPHIPVNLRYESIPIQRQAGSGPRVSFGGLDLRYTKAFRADLAHADFRQAALQHTDFQEADLSHADFGAANLDYADLKSAVLDSANLSIRGAGGFHRRPAVRLRGADLRGAKLRQANLRGAILADADMSCVDEFYDSPCVDLTGAILEGARLTRARLAGADLSGVDLSCFPDARGESAPGSSGPREAPTGRHDVSSAPAPRQCADLEGVDFQGAILNGTNLGGANVAGARNLTQTQLDAACADWPIENLPQGLSPARECGAGGPVALVDSAARAGRSGREHRSGGAASGDNVHLTSAAGPRAPRSRSRQEFR